MRTGGRRGLRSAQQGVALVLAIAFAALGGAALYWVYDVGATVRAKTRLTNAVDAAAYSAALWRARAMNFIAYSNRAIIAQEVAVAQALTRQSWAAYFDAFAGRAEELTRIYPPVGRITPGVHEVARAAREATDAASAAEIALRDAPQSGYKSLLLRSQSLVRQAAGPFAAGAVALEVVKATDSRYFAFALSDDGAYRHLVRPWDSASDRERLKTVVERSLDPYTRHRGHDQWLPLPAPCLPARPSARDLFAEYRKRGGTAFVPGLDRWEAADTGSVHNGVLRRFSIRCRRREVLTMGWGAAEAAAPVPRGSLLGDVGGVRINPLATLLADQSLVGDPARQHRGTGIAPILDLDYRSLANPRFPVSRIAVLAALPQRELRTAAGLGLAASSLVADSVLPRRRLWSMSAAEAYFRRPPTPGTRVHELASLYSPYWQARLVTVDDAEREAANAHVEQ